MNLHSSHLPCIISQDSEVSKSALKIKTKKDFCMENILKICLRRKKMGENPLICYFPTDKQGAIDGRLNYSD